MSFVDEWRYNQRPAFLVWREDETEDDARRVRARDSSEAATNWAEWDDSNSADYNIVKGDDAYVWVRLDAEGSKPERYKVSGETVAHYSARHCPPKEE